jgi:cold shock CspA family protein
MTGQIKTIATEKGFGFIRVGAEDYFFHRTACVTRFDTLQQGDTVTFTPEQGPKGLRAVDVEYVS